MPNDPQPAVWSDVPPTEPGWYWLKQDQKYGLYPPVVPGFMRPLGDWWIEGRTRGLKEITQFGPAIPPPEQQVANAAEIEELKKIAAESQAEAEKCLGIVDSLSIAIAGMKEVLLADLVAKVATDAAELRECRNLLRDVQPPPFAKIFTAREARAWQARADRQVAALAPQPEPEKGGEP